MTSILKNQIIKHLSAFARNLKPEQITMEVLRGKGQLRNLELNEEVLAEKLELPPWLKIISAQCDRVSVNIPWRRLKSAPVQLFVDEIRVTVRMVASSVSSAAPNKSAPSPASHSHKPYDLAERVIETLSLFVQSVEICFESDTNAEIGFGGSITVYNLALESKPPNWVDQKDEVNINLTRIHDKTIRQVLFFKQLSWRLLKIEASAHRIHDQREQGRSKTNSPLRLLTVDGKCRISIKKSSNDCSLIAGKIELILGEIHWLATMLHLRMAIDFYKHLLDLANCQKQREDPALLMGHQQNPFVDSHHRVAHTHQNLSTKSGPLPPSAIPTVTPCAAFRQFDFPQSSHHLFIAKVDLLLLDDSEPDVLPPDWHLEKGAMQAFLHRLRVDFYPHHRVFDSHGELASRQHWARYPTPNSFTDLAKQQLDQHFRLLAAKMDANKRERFVRVWPQLASQNVVIRMDNIVLQQVTEQSTKKDALREMFSMDKRAKERMPRSMSFFHLEVSSYFFAASNAFSVPADSIHLVMAPLELSPDVKSIRWLIYAFESIANAIDAPQISSPSPLPSTGPSAPPQIRIELFMPRVVLTPSPADSSSSTDHRLPQRFIVHTSTVLLSNFALLNDPLVPLPIMFKNRMGDKQFRFVEWAEGHSSVDAKVVEELRRKSREHFDSSDHAELLLEYSKRNEWLLSIPSLWINCDFGPNTWELPFLTDLNLFGSILLDGNDPAQPGNCILVEPRTELGVVLDHFQFVQFIQLLNELSSLLDQISLDRAFFHKSMQNLPEDNPVAVYCQCEKIHLRLVLPSGPTPSPYDLKWSAAGHMASPSNTSISCSDLPADETASNSVQFPLTNRKEFPGSPCKINNDAVELVAGLAVQGGMKTVDSLGQLSNVSVTAKLSADVQPSRKQQLGPLGLPDFMNGGRTQTPSDLESNLEETLSIGTSTSAEQIVIEGTLSTGEDDEVVEAEEVEENGGQQDIATLRRKEQTLGRQVNVLDVLVEELQVYAGAVGGRTTTLGYATNVYCEERLGKSCGEVYEERGTSATSGHENRKSEERTMEEAKLKLEVRSAPRQSSVKVNLSRMDISLSDEVVSQLAPFIENPTRDEHPPALDLSLQKCQIEIKDPKKKFPLRIRLGELNIEDGPSTS